jgi:hypothetical protein
MNILKEPNSPAAAAATTGSEALTRMVWAILLPIIIGGGAALANIAFIGLLALPVLLGGWVGCTWLALAVRQEPLPRLKQLGIALLVGGGLLLLLCVCGKVAGLAGTASTRHGTAEPVDLVVWHVAALGLAFLVSWGQKLQANLTPTAWRGRLLYWFAYCPISALAGVLLARCGLAPGS